MYSHVEKEGYIKHVPLINVSQAQKGNCFNNVKRYLRQILIQQTRKKMIQKLQPSFKSPLNENPPPTLSCFA